MTEYFDVYDSRRTPTGRILPRGTPLSGDEYRIAVQVWLQNDRGQWLVSQRAPGKRYPLKWEPTGGCALAGEDSLQAALREVREELGVALDPESGILFASFRRHVPCWENPGFLDVWMFPSDAHIGDITLQPDEVCAAEWISADEISERIRKGEFVPTEEYAVHRYLPKSIHPDSVRIARIRYMEDLLDRALSGEAPSLRAKHMTILESYYHSPLWQADYAADEAGLLPPTLKRGVLSQDALYNLLME